METRENYNESNENPDAEEQDQGLQKWELEQKQNKKDK